MTFVADTVQLGTKPSRKWKPSQPQILLLRRVYRWFTSQRPHTSSPSSYKLEPYDRVSAYVLVRHGLLAWATNTTRRRVIFGSCRRHEDCVRAANDPTASTAAKGETLGKRCARETIARLVR